MSEDDNNCEVYQQNKYDRNPLIIKFNLTPTAYKFFDYVHIDVFRISNNPFVSIIDWFSRYRQAYPISSNSGISIVESLLNYVTHHLDSHLIYGRPIFLCGKTLSK